MIYLDSSAFTSRYLHDEVHNQRCVELMEADPDWATSRVTIIEVHRALARVASLVDAATARAAFDSDLADTALVEADAATCAIAADIAVRTGVRTLDAIQLASAMRLARPDMAFLTFDERQAGAARELGLTVAR